jgi:uncharacterized membrane protein
MYTRLLSYFSHNKYRLTMFLLLAGATIICVTIWRFRADYSNTSHYGFLVWNLFLAWIPFVISYLTYPLMLNRKQVYILVPAAALLWLLFFPNALYMLTDFQHLALGKWRDLPVWYDVMMLIWFAFTGVLLGMVSLFMMQEIVRREFGRWLGWGFVAIVAALNAAGIYAGRFLRWNSWDIISNPKEILLFTVQHAQDPSLRSVVFIGLFTAFFLFLYGTLYTFGYLLVEQKRTS